MNDLETMETPSPEPSQEPSEEPSPTYKQDQWYGLEHFICLLCGHEDWSMPTLEQHMALYHQGRMVAAPEGYESPAREETVMGDPRGKPEDLPEKPDDPDKPDQPDNPDKPDDPDKPDKPDEDAPQPEHPIVFPDKGEEEDDKD